MTKIIGFAGWSGAGKTSLLTKLIPCLKARGYSVSTVKHAHHAFDIDTPGKDSFLHRASGATEVLVASSARWALMHELRGAPEPELGELLSAMSAVDFILVEGFKRNAHIKIEVHRRLNNKPWLYLDDPSIGAIASDTDSNDHPLPHVALDDIEAVADLVETLAWPLDIAIARLTQRGNAA
ncbi:molybdopterin-guanine dinucleotide biosynthesis protein B [Bordetella genomosp. 4]|uniref:molybdopterin-guanine dinucleotide biosynthesis protein B n=1 Tax=Bordetella genomosp. 4 TaxID=463044 RepID=UPI000B9E0331|nr:molybdopterin-guanine dinucleotide biosynthesis protein B [Bordetella genomosp. 4]OZI54128.1 molybdopterin-guanine dinucleotide biosynthesis protein B [Bordetella genomosp. 4]